MPLLEDLLREPVRVETEADRRFIQKLLKSGEEREARRQGKPVFSPSSMAACLRQVYLTRHARQLGISKLRSTKVEPNFYFLTGEWLHLKWQFACWKLEKKINNPDIFKLLACEYPILSKHGDHGGTVDVLAAINRELTIVDFKGLNVRDFAKIARGEASGYEIQLTDYMMLFNSQKAHHANNNRIERALLVVENKGGPTPGCPIALHESIINLKDYKGVVRHRLGVLREHEAEEKIPEPECQSTSTFQFQGCPFHGYCREEVKAIQKKRKLQAGNSKYEVARPTARKRRARR